MKKKNQGILGNRIKYVIFGTGKMVEAVGVEPTSASVPLEG